MNYKLRGFDMSFQTKPGMFSHTKIDQGTELLVNCMEISPTDVVLDLGCGYGVLGLVAAKLAIRGHVYLIDVDIRAVSLAEENARINNLSNVIVLPSDGFEKVNYIQFNVIVSNPPSHSANEVLTGFIESAQKVLTPGGKLYFVTEKRIEKFIKREFERVFGICHRLASSTSSLVLGAIK